MYTISKLLILIGFFNIILKKTNFIIILISIEILLLGVSILFITTSLSLDDAIGLSFAIYIIILGATESAIGLTILVLNMRDFNH